MQRSTAPVAASGTRPIPAPLHPAAPRLLLTTRVRAPTASVPTASAAGTPSCSLRSAHPAPCSSASWQRRQPRDRSTSRALPAAAFGFGKGGVAKQPHLPYSEEASVALTQAKKEAVAEGHMFAGPNLLLIGTLNSSSPASELLADFNIDADAVRAWLAAHAGPGPVIPVVGGGSLRTSDVDFTREAKDAIAVAREAALQMGSKTVGTAHLLLALLVIPKCCLAQLVLKEKVEEQQLRDELVGLAEREDEPPLSAVPVADQVSQLQAAYLQQLQRTAGDRREAASQRFSVPGSRSAAEEHDDIYE